MTYSSQNPERW